MRFHGVLNFFVAAPRLRRVYLMSSSFKLARRNVLRRRPSTMLVVVNVMLSTLIMAATFGAPIASAATETSHALREASSRASRLAVEGKGKIDAAVNDGIDEGIVTQIVSNFRRSGLIDGVMQEILRRKELTWPIETSFPRATT